MSIFSSWYIQWEFWVSSYKFQREKTEISPKHHKSLQGT